MLPSKLYVESQRKQDAKLDLSAKLRSAYLTGIQSALQNPSDEEIPQSEVKTERSPESESWHRSHAKQPIAAEASPMATYQQTLPSRTSHAIHRSSFRSQSSRPSTSPLVEASEQSTPLNSISASRDVEFQWPSHRSIMYDETTHATRSQLNSPSPRHQNIASKIEPSTYPQYSKPSNVPAFWNAAPDPKREASSDLQLVRGEAPRSENLKKGTVQPSNPHKKSTVKRIVTYAVILLASMSVVCLFGYLLFCWLDSYIDAKLMKLYSLDESQKPFNPYILDVLKKADMRTLSRFE